MKNVLLTISMITLLAAGQSAIADSDNNYTSFDAEAINQVTDARLNTTTAATSSDADLMKASTLNSRVLGDNEYLNNSSENPFSLDFSHE
jgi:predicted secreted protein